MRRWMLCLSLVMSFWVLVYSGLPSPISSRPSVTASAGPIFVGAEEVAIPLNQWGLTHLPDGPMTFLRADNQVHVWFAAARETYYLRGSSFETLAPHQVDGANRAVPVLAPSGAGFDKDYAGGAAVFRAANGADLLMFYHAEENTPNEDCPLVSIGLARSSDGGSTWVRQGQIITAGKPLAKCFRGAGSFDVIQGTDGYYYLYYMEWLADQPHGDSVRLARAPITTDGAPGTWQKYYQGAFSEPGLGGSSDPVLTRPSEEVGYIGIPSVSFNTHLNRYLAVLVGHPGFYYSTSTDLISWEVPQSFWAVPTLPGEQLPIGTDWVYYPSLLSLEQASDTRTTQSAYLYYARGSRTGVEQNAPHDMRRRAVEIGAQTFLPLVVGSNGIPISPLPSPTATPAPPGGVTIPAGGQFHTPDDWTWVCSGDFSVTYPEGSTVILYDDGEDLGLVLRLEPDSHLIVNAPWGGYCEAFYPAQAEQGEQRFLEQMLTQGCDNGCHAVNVRTLDPLGVTLENYWVPPAPAGVTIAAGESLDPAPYWTWVCGGDLTITQPDGDTIILHDQEGLTGLVVMLNPDTLITVNAPWGGACEPFYRGGHRDGLASHIAAAFAQGCGIGCNSVNVKVLDPAGEILEDYWLP